MGGSDSDCEDCEGYVVVNGQDLYFMGDIDQDNILEFIQKFKKLESDLRRKSIDLDDYVPTIRVHVTSDGGDLFAGLAAMDVLEKSKVNVITIAHGACSSAATFILLGGKKRLISRSGHVLIHQISTSGPSWGKYEDLKDELKMCKKLMSTIIETYLRYTKIPKDKLDKLMKHDIYLTAEECLDYGIVHGYE